LISVPRLSALAGALDGHILSRMGDAEPRSAAQGTQHAQRV